MQTIFSRGYSDKRLFPLPIEQDEIRRISDPQECRAKMTPDSVYIESPIQYFHYKAAKHFKDFFYTYNLTRDCQSRVQCLLKRNDQTNTMSKGVVIKIGIVGRFTVDNLNLISKLRGEEQMSENYQIWQASPLLCFQNDLPSESALKNLNKEDACHRILIKSDNFCDESDNPDESTVIVSQNKEQIRDAIVCCLEEPLKQMIQVWLDLIKTDCSNRHASGIIDEILAIRKQMSVDKRKVTITPSLVSSMDTYSRIPQNVKDFLFQETGVHSFGLWRNSIFKVFVSKKTDQENLKFELMKINEPFFSKYLLDVEKRKIVEKPTMKQGDPLLPPLLNTDGTCDTGTLGGFVTKADNRNDIYALTCNHIFPIRDQKAFADGSDGFQEVGTCVFTTRENSCDFAAIEIMESFVDKCDLAFRKTMRKRTNARVYARNLENIGIVHKIGAKTNLTKGYVLSSEYYDKLKDDSNREYIFLVKGIGNSFSEEGDSGSLVFFRSSKNYVDVVGMICGSNPEVYDDDSEDENVGHDPELSGSKSAETKSSPIKQDDKPAIHMSASKYVMERDAAAAVDDDAKGISYCYRINTALDLFKASQGENFAVKFKDDLPSSSSESEDSN